MQFFRRFFKVREGGGKEVILLCPKVHVRESKYFLWCEKYFYNWLKVQVTGLSGKSVKEY